MIRDNDYETTFLHEAEKRGQAQHNVPTDGFAICVQRRLRLGEQLYGTAYSSKPTVARAQDIAEEAWDAAAYAVLDAQTRLANGTESDDVMWHLHEIAVLSAAIHSHVRYLANPDD